MTNKLKLAILGSTKGTDMQAIIDAIKNGSLNASIDIVISDQKEAYILERAKNHDIPHLFVDTKFKNGVMDTIKKTREEYDQQISKILEDKDIDLVLLIGYMRLLSAPFVQKWKNKIMNVHPSLLPAFAGGMDLNVHEEVIKAGVSETGCTIHFVDKGTDTGPIIIQKKCPVMPGDNTKTLKQRVQKLEGEAFIEAIKMFQAGEIANSSESSDIVVPLKRVLISVSDKTGIIEFARGLYNTGVQIISTGGTARKLVGAGIPVVEISTFTGFPEIMNGRVKTLHPLVHAGILGLRDEHDDTAKRFNIKWIDMVVCNLYPFAKITENPDVNESVAIENIDIGGPSMIRSAAKNVNWVGVVVDPEDYSDTLNEIKTRGGLSHGTRKNLSIKAFGHTADYDKLIYNFFAGKQQMSTTDSINEENNIDEKFPDTMLLKFKKDYELRYGENPHQSACVYKDTTVGRNNILNAKILQGKKLSYNNINDADSALAITKEFTEPCCTVVKHANPCGVAIGEDIYEVYKRAYDADSLSAFGGIVSMNRECTKQIAHEISKVFVEIVMAPSYENGALDILSKKKNMRILELGNIKPRKNHTEFKYVEGGILFQDTDTKKIFQRDLRFVTEELPNRDQLKDMLFAWQVLKHIKSNAILIAKDLTTSGVGAGQMSRVDATQMAIDKAGSRASGAILASDAFFPFRDSIDKIASAGVKAIIQPGGSIKDSDVIDACNEHGIAMVFTETRCFKH